MGELFGLKYCSKSGFKYEVSRYLILKSAEMAKENNNNDYLCDWYKLHKLMYYGQIAMLCKFGEYLFEGNITAHDCGPMVDGIDTVAKKYGFDPIVRIIPKDYSVMKYHDIIFSRNQLIVMDNVLQVYGHLNKDEIIELARNDTVWMRTYFQRSEQDKHPIISENMIMDYYQEKFPKVSDDKKLKVLRLEQ